MRRCCGRGRGRDRVRVRVRDFRVGLCLDQSGNDRWESSLGSEKSRVVGTGSWLERNEGYGAGVSFGGMVRIGHEAGGRRKEAVGSM